MQYYAIKTQLGEGGGGTITWSQTWSYHLQ